MSKLETYLKEHARNRSNPKVVDDYRKAIANQRTIANYVKELTAKNQNKNVELEHSKVKLEEFERVNKRLKQYLTETLAEHRIHEVAPTPMPDPAPELKMLIGEVEKLNSYLSKLSRNADEEYGMLVTLREKLQS